VRPGCTTPVEHLDRRPSATGSGFDTPSSAELAPRSPVTVDVPPEDAVVVDHRTTEPAELSADVWRT
jgi:hypothetical protein